LSFELIGEFEAQDINLQIDRILRELGNPEPPLSLDLVRELLKLDRKYFSMENTSFLNDLAHRIKVGGKQVIKRPGLFLDVIRKANLSAFYVPDQKRILIDEDIPLPKHRWIEAHEIAHGLIPWHEEFCFGDNKITLNPECDLMIEAEANYGGARLLFLGDRFGEEARSQELSFKSIREMSKLYKNTLQSTLWRTVEDRAPDQAVFGMVSVLPKHPSIGAKDFGDQPRLIRSQRFREQFSNITPNQVFELLGKHSNWAKGGPVVDGNDVLPDVNGDQFEFKIEGFSNTYSLLSFGICSDSRPLIIPTF